jgi:hypothetical protein
MDGQGSRGSRVSLVESLAMLGIWGVLTVAVFVTYARVPVDELYVVSKSGPLAAAGRVLVYSNFPFAIVAAALLGFALARIFEGGLLATRRSRWIVGALAVAAIGLCLVTAYPGVVDNHDLDAKAINVVPAIGAGIALSLFVVAWRRGGAGERLPWQSIDMVKLGVIGVLAVLALPWLFAAFGFYIGDVPGLGHVFMSKQLDAGHDEVAVHLGGHHGFDGAMLAITGLVLSHAVGTLRRGWGRMALGLWLAFMVVYGVANGVQDFWGEQIVKRGWATSEIPSMYRPRLTPEWGLVLIGIVLVYLLLIRSREPGDSGSTTTPEQTARPLPRRRIPLTH